MNSVFSINYPSYYVILIDNGSSDESVKMIIRWWEKYLLSKSASHNYKVLNRSNNLAGLIIIEEGDLDKAKKVNKALGQYRNLPPNMRLILIKNRRNYGFAKGNNIGINFIMRYFPEVQYILLLNNDTVVDKDFLNSLIFTFKQDPKIGIVSALILPYKGCSKNHKKYTRINVGGGKITKNGLLRSSSISCEEIGKEDSLFLDWVSGTALAVKKSVVKNIGLFREDFFAYVEDVEYCTRARNAGFKVACALNSLVYHKLSATSKQGSPLILYLSVRNYLQYLKGYYKKYSIILYLIDLIVNLVKKIIIGKSTTYSLKWHKLSIRIMCKWFKALWLGIIHGITDTLPEINKFLEETYKIKSSQ